MKLTLSVSSTTNYTEVQNVTEKAVSLSLH